MRRVDMKKTTLMMLFVMVLVTAALLCTCNADKVEMEDLVSVSFGENTRALEAQLEPFNKNVLYWKYAARKSLVPGGTDTLDGSGLRSGETEAYDEAHAEPVTANGAPGLDAKIPGFSQGLWDFMLFGYKKIVGDNPATTDEVETDYEYYVLVYSGEAKEQSLRKDNNSVDIVVSPVSDHGNGTLFVDTGNISFIPVQTDTSKVSTFSMKVFVDGTELTSGTTVSIAPGAHAVKVQVVHTYDTITYVFGEGNVTATVYSNLTTRVFGSLNELVTFAQFDADVAYPSFPQGTLFKEWNEQTGKWTITFTSTNPDSEPTTYAWYVNGVSQTGEEESTFVYTPGFESVNITCVFGNTSGTGSASVYIQ